MLQKTDIIKQSMYTAKLGKLLAQENISVQFDSEATTASFSPQSRTLTLPYSAPLLDVDIQEAFLFHEVSHAIHLPQNSMDIVKESGVDHDIFNIVLDIRDERLIKLKYPGCIKIMNVAYEKLLDQKFFGDVDKIPFRSFADRLNVYAKCGAAIGSFIPMNPEEHNFYNLCMKAETIEDLIDLSRKLEVMNENSIDARGLVDYFRGILAKTDDVDIQEMSEAEKNKLIAEELRKIKEQTVQDIFNGTIEESCIKNAIVVDYTTVPLSSLNIIHAKEYIEFVKNKFNEASDAKITQSVREMRKSISQSVDSMVRVFETKKAAEKYKNVKISETGSLDINKVYRYKFDDKIFRQAKSIPNCKNHAYYILVDLSGSMSRILPDVIEQIVVITEFFRRVQVPYKVVGFGMGIDYDLLKNDERFIFQNPMPGIIRNSSFKDILLEFMNNNQTTLEHNLAIVGLIDFVGFNLGSTPTAFAVASSEQYAMKFFNQSGTTSNHMIVMTDGSPTDLVSTGWGHRGKTIVMTDSQTKKTIISKGNADYATINCIGKVFENRHNIQFYTISLIGSLMEKNTCAFFSGRITDQMRSEWLKKGYTKIVDSHTKNEVLLAKPFSVDTNISDLPDDISERNSGAIARAMLKNMKKVKKSRNFLNALAEKLS